MFSKDEKFQLVDVHNKFRAKVAQGKESRGSPGPQPPASDMMEMTWDEELAAIAQRWADQCRFGHDENRNVARFRVGQNVYQSFGSPGVANSQMIVGGLDGWYGEVDMFPSNGVGSFG